MAGATPVLILTGPAEAAAGYAAAGYFEPQAIDLGEEGPGEVADLLARRLEEGRLAI